MEDFDDIEEGFSTTEHIAFLDGFMEATLKFGIKNTPEYEEIAEKAWKERCKNVST